MLGTQASSAYQTLQPRASLACNRELSSVPNMGARGREPVVSHPSHHYTTGNAGAYTPGAYHTHAHRENLGLSSAGYAAPLGAAIYTTQSAIHRQLGLMHASRQQQLTPIYTDNASTKLSDPIRRKCFNCCATDTSTWRRSSLNPGKVVSMRCLWLLYFAIEIRRFLRPIPLVSRFTLEIGNANEQGTDER